MTQFAYKVEQHLEGTVMHKHGPVETLFDVHVSVTDTGVLSLVFKVIDGAVCFYLDTEAAKNLSRSLFAAAEISAQVTSQE